MFSSRAAFHRIRFALLICGILFLPSRITKANSVPVEERRLSLFHLHTNERIDIVYKRGDSYLPDAIDRLDHFLRDHRTGDVTQLDPRLFDLLHDLTAALGRAGAEIDIVCGYRTPWSNEFLRRTTSGVAMHSQHIEGKAIDIRIPGVPTAEVRDAALRLHRGGVGYYPQSQFVHVDVGRVRHW
jgi:uncharacterized protein YcbK (DUF882 family)